MARYRTLGLLVVATLLGTDLSCAATHHRRSHASHHHPRFAGYSRPYSSQRLPTPTCRYADGTPYDPDIIGGVNHVGDGGPTVNLGGFNPCGY